MQIYMGIDIEIKEIIKIMKIMGIFKIINQIGFEKGNKGINLEHDCLYILFKKIYKIIL